MNAIVEQPSDKPLAPRVNGNGNGAGPLSFLSGGRAETAKALAAAIAACTSVRKEDYNAFHKYRYASADAIIEEGRKALAGAGLALLPMEASLNGWERTGEERFELVRTFVLLHTSGECTPLRVVWPVCVEKGRPLDKATAIADTLSLSYLLRDLLCMARVDPSDDVNARDDRPREQQQRQASAETKEQRGERGRRLKEQVAARELTMTQEGRCKEGELFAYVVAAVERVYGAPSPPWEQWKPEVRQTAIDAARAFKLAHPAKQTPAPAPAPQEQQRRTADDAPQNGAELDARLSVWDAREAGSGYCRPGELYKYVAAFGSADCAMGKRPMAEWPSDVVKICWRKMIDRCEEMKRRKIA